MKSFFLAARTCALALVLTGCLTRGLDLPPGSRVMVEFYLAYGKVAGLFPSSPDAPEGMQGSLVRDLGDITAVGLSVDEQGNIFVAASHRQNAGVSDNRTKPYWLLDDLAAEHVDDRRAYIEDWANRGKDPLSWYTDESDVVLRLRDTTGDGEADEQIEVASFNDVLTGIGSSLLADGGALYYTNIPDLWILRDTTGDGIADQREQVAHGFGISTSLLGHDLHGLTWGPDGRIYFSVGDRGYNVVTREGKLLRPPMVVTRGAVFRMQPDGSELEVFATGLRNPQDLVFDDFGNLFTGDNNGDGADEARLVYVMEGSDTGWVMSYQSMERDDYYHGPWEAERLWETPHPGQPAWVHPPIGYIGRGPAGAAMNPGLGGLPEQFDGKILISDYQYAVSRSGVRAYEVEPSGAGFVLAETELVIGGVLPTDLDFGPEGRVYVSEFDQFQTRSKIHRFEDPDHIADPAVVALGAMLREGFDERSSAELATLLGHADRRARRGAQHALAARGDTTTLGGVALAEDAPLLARVHALWGLGQLGAEGIREAGIDDLAWTRAGDPELRTQAIRVAGEAGADWLTPELVRAIGSDEPPRLRAMAATSLGKLRATDHISAVIDLLRRNDDVDVYLRHSAIHALVLMDDFDAVLAYADDPAPSVRRAVVVALRRAADPRLERFLRDPDPSIVVEAARAIHDLDLIEAFPTLAALDTEGALPLAGDDLQSTGALHRRVIGANLALGGARNATAIAKYAANPDHPEAMRREALESLGEFTNPGPRERVFGFYRDWPARPPETVHAALDVAVPALLGTPFEARTLEIALANGRVPLPDEDLLERVDGWLVDENIKVASLRVLGERRSPLLERALEISFGSRSALLRAEARDVLAETQPDQALASIRKLSPRASLVERQRSYATLAALGNEAADAELRDALRALQVGELDDDVALDALLAARARSGTLAAELAVYDASFAEGDLVSPRRVALAGGDAERGRLVFDGAGDCHRCHTVERGKGGRAGPNLRGVGSRRKPEEMLESVVVPQAEISQGYGSVGVVLRDGSMLSGTLVSEDEDALILNIKGDEHRISVGEIASRTAPASGMPPMGLALSLGELRDLIAYLRTL